MANREQQATALQDDWDSNPRWQGVVRDYTAAEVVRLRGSLCIEHTLARRGAGKLWTLLGGEPYVNALGATTGEQALQQVKAGLKAIYLSDWQEQSLYPAMSVPLLVRAVNQDLQRADQVQWAEGKHDTDYFAPIVADGDGGAAPGSGERMRALIEAGAAGVHFDDQLASAKNLGQPGGKVLLPTRDALAKLAAARLAADVMGVPTLLIARTDAEGADLLSSDIDERDRPFCTGERSAAGHYQVRPGIEQALARALAYAPYADLLWCETGKPDLAFAKRFAAAVHARFPGKLLAYHCSPSYNWKKNLDDATIAKFQKELGAMGYKFQFISLAGFHALHDGMFKLAHGYARRQMTAFVALQETERGGAEQGLAAFRPAFFEARQVPELIR